MESERGAECSDILEPGILRRPLGLRGASLGHSWRDCWTGRCQVRWDMGPAQGADADQRLRSARLALHVGQSMDGG